VVAVGSLRTLAGPVVSLAEMSLRGASRLASGLTVLTLVSSTFSSLRVSSMWSIVETQISDGPSGWGRVLLGLIQVRVRLGSRVVRQAGS